MTCTGNRKNSDRGLQNIYYYNIKNIPHLFIPHHVPVVFNYVYILYDKKNNNHQFYLVIKSQKHHEGTYINIID